LGGDSVLFGWLHNPFHGGSASCLVQSREVSAGGMLQAEATPPNCFARRQCVGNKIYARARMLAREQSLKELPRAHSIAQQGARLRLKLKVSADLGGCGCLDLGQWFIARHHVLPANG